MTNTTLLYSLGQTILDSSPEAMKNSAKIAKEPKEDPILEGYEDDCEKCQIEKLKKPCSICED